MATEKAPTRDEIMEELSKKGINNLVELLDALMPDETETGGFVVETDGNSMDSNPDTGNLGRKKPFPGDPEGFDAPYGDLLRFLGFSFIRNM